MDKLADRISDLEKRVIIMESSYKAINARLDSLSDCYDSLEKVLESAFGELNHKQDVLISKIDALTKLLDRY